MDEKQYSLDRIKQSQEQIIAILKSINHYEVFRTLLCLLDVFTDSQIRLTNSMIAENNTNKQILHHYNHNFFHLHIVYKLIDYVLGLSKSFESILPESPQISTIVLDSTHPDFPNASERIAQFVTMKDAEIFFWDMNFEGDDKYHRRYFIIQNASILKNTEPVQQCIKLVQAYWRLMVGQTALTQNIPFELDNDGKITFLQSPNEKARRSEIKPRDISVEYHLFPDWVSEVIESHIKALENLENPVQNRKDVLEEFRQKKIAYENLPDFSRLFFEYYKIQFTDFHEICTELCMIAYDSKSPVRMPRSRLVRIIKKHTKKPKDTIEKILDDFIWKKGDTIFEKFLIYDGNYLTYSWDICNYTINLPLHYCYEKLFNNDQKGKRYEEECRKTFKNNSLFVCTDRLLISKQVVPTQFFRQIHSKVKKQTDLDVVGIKSKILFVIECKAKKKPNNLTHIYNELEKHYNELLWKVQWISSHKEEFLKIAKNQNYKIPDFNYVVPLLVTNIVNPTNDKYNSINFTELDFILNDITVSDNLEHTTELPSGIKIKIPIIEV